MRFEVQPDAFARYPRMRLAIAVASGIDNRQPRAEVVTRWRESWRAAAGTAAAFGNAQSHPRVVL